MGRYRKRPVVIEAMRLPDVYDIDGRLALEDWIGDGWQSSDGRQCRYVGDTMVIPTLEGDHTASPGDWIIRGIKGELYPCKPDIFDATYERVD